MAWSRLRIAIWGIVLAAGPAAGQIPPPPAPHPVIETTTGEHSRDRGIVALQAGRRRGVQIGDRFWVFPRAAEASGAETSGGPSKQGGAIRASWGEIYLVTEDESVVHSQVNGKFNLSQIMTLVYVSNFEALRTLWALKIIGVIEPLDSPSISWPRKI